MTMTESERKQSKNLKVRQMSQVRLTDARGNKRLAHCLNSHECTTKRAFHWESPQPRRKNRRVHTPNVPGRQSPRKSSFPVVKPNIDKLLMDSRVVQKKTIRNAKERVFTEEEKDRIIRQALDKFDKDLSEQYYLILNQTLTEQSETLRRSNLDFVSRKLSNKSESSMFS